MTTIDLDLLATVTGGAAFQQRAPSPQQQQEQGDPQAAPSAGGSGFLSGLDQFLSFLQSPNFGQIVGGLQGILQSFMGQGNAPSTGPSDQQQA